MDARQAAGRWHGSHPERVLPQRRPPGRGPQGRGRRMPRPTARRAHGGAVLHASGGYSRRNSRSHCVRRAGMPEAGWHDANRPCTGSGGGLSPRPLGSGGGTPPPDPAGEAAIEAARRASDRADWGSGRRIARRPAKPAACGPGATIESVCPAVCDRLPSVESRSAQRVAEVCPAVRVSLPSVLTVCPA